MGVSTVEAHLSHVYRKLGIRSRTELGPRLAMQREEAASNLGLSGFRAYGPEA